MRRLQDSVSHPGVRRIASFFSHPERSRWGLTGVIAVVALTITLTACGDDSSTSVNDDESSSSKTVALSSSSSQKGTEPAEVSSSSKKNTASSSWSEAIGSSNSKPSSSSQKSDPGTSSGMTSSSKKAVASSSSRHSGPAPESSSSKKISSSSAIPASSGNLPSSSSKKVESSSSEYVPFDHSKTLAEDWRVGENRYKQFTDPRNGRSYYYIKIIGKNSSKDKDSVTIMAENLNIGEMVQGKDDQKDDTKIERYCYNNDTTLCDEFGGLYQWTEMMQLPSRCNTESCSDLIQPNHQGICPDGWRLFTYDDFAVVMGYKDEFESGIKGLRSAYAFGGNNYSGFSLTGAGMRTVGGGFDKLRSFATWFFPTERDPNEPEYANAGVITSSGTTGPKKTSGDLKVNGFSVRCVKLEN